MEISEEALTLTRADSAQSGNGPLLTVSHLSMSYGSSQILHEVSFQLHKGETLVVIGPSGGGKSSLLRCINLLEPIDGGEIRLHDRPLIPSDANRVRQQVGIVFQQFDLFPHLRILDNLTLAPRHVLKQDRSEAEHKASSLLKRFGLAGKARSYPHQLSGGEQQRIAIIRAIMMEPEILLFDEITSSLDPELSGEVLGLVLQLVESGITAILVTHEIQFAREVGDRMMLLVDGHVVEVGTPEEMIRNPKEERTRQFLTKIASHSLT